MTLPNSPAGGTATSAPPGTLSGGISFFGGPTDPTSGSTTASGAPVSTPGIAVNNQSTLGGWWLVKLPNGVITLVRQTDIGPANWTGRVFDFTYSLLSYLGYTTSNFPTTTASTPSSATGVYIGKAANVNDLASQFGSAISSALSTLGATPQQQNTLVGQIDAASGKFNPAVIAVAPKGQPSSNKSTTPSGDAAPAGINVPNPLSGLSGLIAFLTSGSNWIRLGEVLLGALLLLLGLRALTGSEGNPIVITQRAVRRVR